MADQRVSCPASQRAAVARETYRAPPPPTEDSARQARALPLHWHPPRSGRSAAMPKERCAYHFKRCRRSYALGASITTRPSSSRAVCRAAVPFPRCMAVFPASRHRCTLICNESLNHAARFGHPGRAPKHPTCFVRHAGVSPCAMTRSARSVRAAVSLPDGRAASPLQRTTTNRSASTQPPAITD